MRLLPLLLALSIGCRESEEAIDADGDGFLADADCNDGDAAVNPGALELCNGIDDNCNFTVDDAPSDGVEFFLDSDGDGYGNPSVTASACDAPTGYGATAGDCDDGDADIHPDAPEADCTDPVDYNCDGSVGYADADGDGFAACQDCDDSAAAISPVATEACDSIDNDCDGAIDEAGATGQAAWYSDADGDGHGDPATAQFACSAPEGTVASASDCNDASAAALPGGTEVCDDLDNDCNGSIDGADAADAPDWYADGDGDGFGARTTALTACDSPAGYTADDTDCDDDEASVFPGASEICDEQDNNCDGTVDEGHDTTWYVDYDGDGFGRSNITVEDCERPNGFSATADDCDDLDEGAFPGADELCNGTDDDCDGALLADEGDDDDDGFLACDDDCDDTDATVSPAGVEVWYDDVDQDCDGASDHDQDGDGDDAVASGGTDRNDLDPSCSDDCADGGTQVSAGESCQQILADYPSSIDDVYWIDVNADGDTSDAFEVMCDMTTAEGGWTRFWWYEPNAGMGGVSDMLGGETFDCDVSEARCFARMPVTDPSELLVKDSNDDWGRWEFESGNRTSDAAFNAFTQRTQHSAAHLDAWNPREVSGGMSSDYHCNEYNNQPSDNCDSFWYRNQNGIISFNLDDDTGWGETAFAAGWDNGNQLGVGAFDYPGNVPNYESEGLWLYYR